MTKKILVVLSLALVLSANLRAQVTIGALTAPTAGALLDLNRGATGGLLLSNVALTNLSVIPANTFVNISTEQDTNQELVGMIVYNTDATTGIGIYVWDGDDWIKPCAPPAPGAITFSETKVCGSGATFTAKIDSVKGATGYVWELPDGLSGSSNDTIITIGWTIEGVYPAGSITVRAESSCGAGTRRVSTQDVTVGAIPAKPTGTGIATNVGNNFTFSASVPVDHEIYWYTTETGGSPISDKIGKPSFTEPLTTTTTYYAESHNSVTGCVSTSRLAVTGIPNCTSTPNVVITQANVAFASGTEHTYPVNGGLTFSPPVKIVGLPARTTQFDGGSSGAYIADYRDHQNSSDVDDTDTYGSWFSWCMVKQYEDILCPGEWRVPTHSDFVTYVGGTSIDLSSLPANHGWQRGGYAEGSSTVYLGMGGYYWSSTEKSPGAAYDARVGYGTNTLSTVDGGHFYSGHSLRCVK